MSGCTTGRWNIGAACVAGALPPQQGVGDGLVFTEESELTSAVDRRTGRSTGVVDGHPACGEAPAGHYAGGIAKGRAVRARDQSVADRPRRLMTAQARGQCVEGLAKRQRSVTESGHATIYQNDHVPVEILSHAVWLSLRCGLSFRNGSRQEHPVRREAAEKHHRVADAS